MAGLFYPQTQYIVIKREGTQTHSYFAEQENLGDTNSLPYVLFILYHATIKGTFSVI